MTNNRNPLADVEQALNLLRQLSNKHQEPGTYTGYGYVHARRLGLIDVLATNGNQITSTFDVGYTPHASALYYFTGMTPKKIIFEHTLVQRPAFPGKLFLLDGNFTSGNNSANRYIEIPVEAIIKIGEVQAKFLADDSYSKQEKHSVKTFTKDAIYILLSRTHLNSRITYPSVKAAEQGFKKGLAEDFSIAANHHFYPKHAGQRFLADLALFLALPIGLLVWGTRVMTGRSTFFSTAKTNREVAFESAINACYLRY